MTRTLNQYDHSPHANYARCAWSVASREIELRAENLAAPVAGDVQARVGGHR